MKIIGQDNLVADLERIFKIFSKSDCQIRPHFFLTGGTGTGKTAVIKSLCKDLDLNYINVNAAQLTKEGTAGNSVSKALSPLINNGKKPTIVFVDEFDKLFISGNCNTDLAHESTNGVQNEFLTILEEDKATVFGDYGKYINVSVNNCLFIFAGAFNDELIDDIDKLRELGLKTEFLGRVSLVYTTQELKLEHYYQILDNLELFDHYLKFFKKDKSEVAPILKERIRNSFNNNVIGARLIRTIVHDYFIKGSRDEKEEKQFTYEEMDF